MQRLKKILKRILVALIAVVLALIFLFQLPSVQRLITNKAANYISSTLGLTIEINDVSLKPLDGNLSFNGIKCTGSEHVSLNCEGVDINGLNLILNSEEPKTIHLHNVEVIAESIEELEILFASASDSGSNKNNSNFSVDLFTADNISWNIADHYIGYAKNIELNNISYSKDSIILNSILIDSGETSYPHLGWGANTVKIPEFKGGLEYLIEEDRYALKIDIGSFVSDSLEADGEVVINNGEPVADVNLKLNSNYYSSLLNIEHDYDLGNIEGNLSVRDSLYILKNCYSENGVFIDHAEVSSDLKRWKLRGSKDDVSISSEGTDHSSIGTISKQSIGSIDYEVSFTDSTYSGSLSSSRLNGSEFLKNAVLNNVNALFSGDFTSNCDISISSDEVSSQFSTNPSNPMYSSGTAEITESKLIEKLFNLEVKLGEKAEVVWVINESENKYSASLESVDYSNLTFLDLSVHGEMNQRGELSGDLTCRSIVLDDSEELASNLRSIIEQANSRTRIRSNWKSAKGIDGELVLEGSLGKALKDTMHLEFEVVTEALSEDQTSSWFNIPFSTDSIEIEGVLRGTLLSPEIDLYTHSRDLTLMGESIFDCEVAIKHKNGVNRIASQFLGLGELKKGMITVLGTASKSNLDLTTAINKLPLSYVNPLLQENTVDLGGEVNAVLSIDGNPLKPQFTGSGEIVDGRVDVDYLGTTYNVNGPFNVETDAIELNGLDVNDSKGGTGFLVGTAIHEEFKNWNLDVSLFIEDNPIEIMNIPYSSERYFYGRGLGVGKINVFSYSGKMVIEADIETSKGTEFVLPLDAASYGEWSSFIEIVEPLEESEEIVEKAYPLEIVLDLNIEVNSDSEARIVFDEKSGNEINGRCKGHLHLDLHDFERLEMYGDLEVVEGDYVFTVGNILSKEFMAVPGGSIKWFGDPYNASIDITTMYNTRASLKPIMPELNSTNKQLVELDLILDGDLMRPDILFDIKIPESSAQYQASLASLISNEEERNRQAVSLLVLNQFLPSTWHATAVGATGIQENSSELITSQLGYWLSGLSDDLNVGIDYDSPTNTSDETAIAIALSTQLLDDKLHIEGEVGTTNLYTGTTDDLQIQDVRIKYDINDDGTLQLTGYATQRGTIPGLEGENVQGVGVLLNKDFDNIWDLFKRKSKKK